MAKDAGAKQTRDRSTQERRRLIIETAAACFIEGGFHQTSVRDIAAAAGISLGNLYNHFEGKDALIAEIAELEALELKAVEDALAHSEKPIVALERFVDDYLGYASQPENAVLAAEIMAEAIRNPAIGEGFAENNRKLAHALSRVLARGIETRQFDPDLDTKQTANLIIDLIEGVAMRSAFSGRETTKSTRNALKSMICKSVRV